MVVATVGATVVVVGATVVVVGATVVVVGATVVVVVGATVVVVGATIMVMVVVVAATVVVVVVVGATVVVVVVVGGTYSGITASPTCHANEAGRSPDCRIICRECLDRDLADACRYVDAQFGRVPLGSVGGAEQVWIPGS